MAFDPQKYRDRWQDQQNALQGVEKGDLRDELQGRALLDILLELDFDLREQLSLLQESRIDLERRVGDVKVNRESRSSTQGEFIEALELEQIVRENTTRLLNALDDQLHVTESTVDGAKNDLTESDGR